VLRLLFLNYEFPPVGGGAAYASLATARELVSMGHRVDFLTMATRGAEHNQEIDGVQVHRVPGHRRGVHDIGIPGALSFVAFAAARLRSLAKHNRYDAYHYYFGLPTGLLSCIPGGHNAKPYVVSLRGSDVPGYDGQLQRHHKLLLPITRRIWTRAHRVIANSQGLRELAHAAIPDVRIDVIPNGVAPSNASPARSQPGSRVRILAVGRLIRRKGLDTLIRALGESGKEMLYLDIAGDGPERNSLGQLARNCGVGDRVCFHGFTDRESLDALYAQADIFALVSRAESCSMALLEAMSAGLPIVASRVGGNAELVQHDANGLLIEPDNVAQLRSALCQLAEQPQLRARFGAANRSVVEQRHGWRSVARCYEAVFQDALHAPATRFTARARHPADPAQRVKP
jgi:glycosyltransferase involved in cell wall biosynthesis